jgi:thiamine-monophosphate kinase
VTERTEPELTLADLGESEILARIFPRLPESADTLVGPGDDCAVMTAADGRFVITTDMMVQGPDFRLELTSG